jgi:hypothetical protein
MWPHTFKLPALNNSSTWLAAKQSLKSEDLNASLLTDRQLFSLAMYIYCKAGPGEKYVQHFM